MQRISNKFNNICIVPRVRDNMDNMLTETLITPTAASVWVVHQWLRKDRDIMDALLRAVGRRS